MLTVPPSARLPVKTSVAAFVPTEKSKLVAGNSVKLLPTVSVLDQRQRLAAKEVCVHKRCQRVVEIHDVAVTVVAQPSKLTNPAAGTELLTEICASKIENVLVPAGKVTCESEICACAL